MNKKRYLTFILGSLCFVGILGFTSCVPKQITKDTKTTTASKDTSPVTTPKKEQVYVPDSTSTLVELTTKFGVIKFELFCTATEHKENFITLIKENYYDSLLFHRVINGFMVQGGDPDSRNASPQKRLGTGGPGYTVDAEINHQHVHVKGALCAARMPDDMNPQKASSGSQFYIVHGRQAQESYLDALERERGFTYTSRQRQEYATLGGAPQLDGEYTVFGRAYEGLDVLDKIASTPTDAYDRPKENVTMSFKILKH